jgi:allantoicase
MTEQIIHATPDANADELARRWCNLADGRIGTAALCVTDEFFAPATRMFDHVSPVFITDKFDDHGKWMDGWETKRRRGGGHDFCVLRLGLPGVIRAFDIDTSHFTGNFPLEASIDACWSDDQPDDDTQWQEIVPKARLRGDFHNLVPIDDERQWNYLRLHIYPDGGIARLKVYGEGAKDWSAHSSNEPVDLAAMANGARVIAWSDAHFGAASNILAPGKGINMGDGWETGRRRGPGFDWMIIRLGTPGVISTVRLDTHYFKGNYPDRFSLQAARIDSSLDDDVEAQSAAWAHLLDDSKLEADASHEFDGLVDLGPVSHVRLNIFPDGGVSRLRLFGTPEST